MEPVLHRLRTKDHACWRLRSAPPSSGRTHPPWQWPRRAPMMDPIRRNILATGVAATAVAAAPRVFAQQSGQGGMSFYEKGPVRIRFEEAGSGFPLLLIAAGGLNSPESAPATPPPSPIH